MSSQYFTSKSEKNNAQQLLSMSIPSYRQAYSDRTAWIMSVMSELAYIKFNPLLLGDGLNKPINKYIIKKISTLASDNTSERVSASIDKTNYDPKVEHDKLERYLSEFQFTLKKTFNNKGTQAIFIDAGDYIILSFRGTEPERLHDLKIDLKANLIPCELLVGQLHEGFKEAFNHVRGEIEQEITQPQYSSKPLFITGHSLGGALATVATKYITHKGGIAACYTFGSPRVGNDDWINNIKTPIHRVVNAADYVTMLPPGDVSVSIVSLILRCVPFIGEPFSKYVSEKFGRYMHAGNMRYLTNSTAVNFNDVNLLYSVSFVYRIKAFIIKSLPVSTISSDHAIKNYVKKLMVIALKRNK